MDGPVRQIFQFGDFYLDAARRVLLRAGAAAVQLAIIPFDGGAPLKAFDLPPTTVIGVGLRWLPDGSALTYVNNQHGVSNICTQPLRGGPPRQLTNFTSDQIFRFAWSPDGK